MEKLFCLSPPLWKEMFVSTRWKRCLVTILSWFLATSVTRPKGSKNGEVYVFYVCMEKNKVRSKSGNSGYNVHSLISIEFDFLILYILSQFGKVQPIRSYHRRYRFCSHLDLLPKLVSRPEVVERLVRRLRHIGLETEWVRLCCTIIPLSEDVPCQPRNWSFIAFLIAP